MSEYDDICAKYDRDPLCKNYDFKVARGRVAELEAELRYMTIERDSLTEDRDDLLTELAALKAQECEGCEHDIEGVACQCGQGVSVDGDIPSTDFACNRWTARAEEGGEE